MKFEINYHGTNDTMFLDIVEYGVVQKCIGSADLVNGKWIVTVNAPYDPETDSDARLVGEYDTSAEAHLALWDERYTAESA